MYDIAVLKVIADLAHCHERTVVLGLCRGCAQMWCHDAALCTDCRGVRKIGNIFFDLARCKCVHHRLLIHEKISRKVEHDRRRLHHCNRIRANHLSGGIQKRHMNRDIVALAVNVLHVADVLHAPGKAPRCTDGNIRIVAVHFHSHVGRRIGNQNTDCTKSDNT